MSLSLLALAAAAATHSITIDHNGKRIDAVYHARTDVSMKTVGSAPPTRMDNQRCRWNAAIVVERKMAHAPTLARTLPSDRTLSGNQPGACPGNKRVIEREIALREDEVRKHLVAVAEQDRNLLVAELDAARTLAVN